MGSSPICFCLQFSWAPPCSPTPIPSPYSMGFSGEPNSSGLFFYFMAREQLFMLCLAAVLSKLFPKVCRHLWRTERRANLCCLTNGLPSGPGAFVWLPSEPMIGISMKEQDMRRPFILNTSQPHLPTHSWPKTATLSNTFQM